MALQKDLFSLHNCIKATHTNVESLHKHITAWSYSPLYTRFLPADECSQNIILRKTQMDSSRQEVRKTVTENLRVFQECGKDQNIAATTDSKTQLSITLLKRKHFKTFIGLTHQLRNRANVITMTV